MNREANRAFIYFYKVLATVTLMFQIFIGSILTDNVDAIKYVILALLALSILTTIVKKLFKFALVLALIAIVAYYLIPGVITTIALPPLP
jgi:ABC-type multidrug transport system permease subunit